MLIYLEVEVEHQRGKFASKDSVTDEVVGLIDGNNIDAEDGEYEVVAVNVLDAPPKARVRRGPKKGMPCSTWADTQERHDRMLAENGFCGRCSARTVVTKEAT